MNAARSGFGAALAALAALALAACSATDEVDDGAGLDDGADIEFDVDATLTVDDRGFDPARLDLVVGDTVELVNEGDEPHGLASADYETGLLEPGERATLFFDAVGTVDGHDAGNPDHEVTIVIEPPPAGSG